MSAEPVITVDGVLLTEAQAITVRVSLTNWNFEDEYIEKLGPIGVLYRDRANEVLGMMRCFRRPPVCPSCGAPVSCSCAGSGA